MDPKQLTTMFLAMGFASLMLAALFDTVLHPLNPTVAPLLVAVLPTLLLILRQRMQ